jgi:hypothetical protein
MSIQPSRAFGIVLAIAALVAPAAAGPDQPAPLSAGAQAMLKRTLGAAAQPARPGEGRQLFEAVLASASFRSAAVGPFDVHVLAGEGPAAGKAAEGLRDTVLATLAKATDVVMRFWPSGGEGLVSATRFPVVIAAEHADYLQLVALLDHCERAGYSGWAPTNSLDSPDVLGAEVARTWEVQVFDLSHDVIANRKQEWLTHGVGYYSLAMVANRALRRGAWGLVPPWLSAGLIDECDIAAYGEAWVGEEGWTSQTPGWSRTGWAGFVPQGAVPPAPLAGPPATLATTVAKTGDPWLDPKASRTRHWTELLADLKTEAPASFARAAETESFLPRDRASARCLLHLMLSGGAGRPSLTALLDRPPHAPADGMPDSEPLPVIFARALGGVPDVDRLEALDTRALLTELARPDLVVRVEQDGGAGALALSDHRAQSAWLYKQRCDAATRSRLYQAFLEIEYVQQMAEWRVLGLHLDAGLRAALGAARTFPKDEKATAQATAALRAGLAAPVGTPTAAPPVKPSRARGR